MRIALLITLLALPVVAAAPAGADEREAFYGSWGTPKQCARAPIKEGGTVPAEPFEIGPLWLKHGRVWCRLRWYPIEQRENGAFTGAQAQCGEDSVRSYFIGMERSDDSLRLRWDFELKTKDPLRLCPSS
ncbi:MAG: hypothetical protein AAFP67_02480 [Pseudomonadota bacterium]